jgi:hypothetical protein
VAGELRALIGVEDLGPAMPGERFVQRLDAERRLHGDRQSPGQNPAAEPVDHRGEIDEAAGHGHVGDIHGPDLVRMVDAHAAEQVRVDLVPRRRFRGIRLAVDRLHAHPLHQRSDMPAADFDPLFGEEIPQHPAPRERKLKVDLVHPTHDDEIGRRYGSGQVIDAATADPERPCLLGDRQIVLAVDHRFALSRPALPSAPDKKSLVSVSSPIFA